MSRLGSEILPCRDDSVLKFRLLSLKVSITDTGLGFNCTCFDGYRGDGWSCKDIDECYINSHECDINAHCTDIDGSYICECDDGWSGDGYVGNCTDIDECADDGLHNCDINANCTNNNGSFSCECNEGYVGDGVNCFDLDECVYGDHELG